MCFYQKLLNRAEAFAKYLSNKGWPATHISGSLNQDNRISAISRLQKFECRILVTTDLVSGRTFFIFSP